MAGSKVTLKLLIDAKSKRVLFAEAGKDCIDFLFQILCLPIATVIKLLNKQGMVGSLAHLYGSIENLNDSYMQQGQNKDFLLNPKMPGSAASVPLLLLNGTATANTFYTCSAMCQQYKVYVSDDPKAVCPRCSSTMTRPAVYVDSPPVSQASKEGGYVKGVVTYMVMDNLVVQPMSTISGITLLNKFDVKEVSALQEKEVEMGMNEAVKLLKTCLYSKKVLTDVFLNSNM